MTAPPRDPTAAARPAGPPAPVAGPAALRLRDVTVDYGGRVAVDRVSVTVAPGGWTALVGPNGAGKTSLLQAATGAVASRGKLAVGHENLAALPARARARRVALVPQRPVIPSGMPVTDYVLLGRTAHLPYLGVESADDRRVVAETLERLDLGGLARRPVSRLSGGEQQRVVLARALAQRTPVLLLDEPTSALDIGHRQQVLELVDRLRRESLLTVLVAMHDLTLAAQYADHLVLLDGGRVAATGAPREVLTVDRVAAHFGADVHVLDLPDGGLAVVPARIRQ